MNNFVVSKITRTCDAGCSATSATNLLTVGAGSNTLTTCVAAPTPATDLTGKSALQCHQCSANPTGAACKNAQSPASAKVGGIGVSRTAACTECYVSATRASAEEPWCS